MAGFGILNDPSQLNAGAAASGMDQATGMAALAARGQGPSAADAQMRAGLQQAQQAQQAAAASTRGNFGMAGAQHSAQAQSAGMQQEAINRAAALRAQEQQAGLAQYGQFSGQQAQINQQGAIANAQMAEQQNIANQQSSGQLLGGITSGIAGLATGGLSLLAQPAAQAVGTGAKAAFSDERLKAERPNAGSHADAFLASIAPHEYTWTHPDAAPNGNAAAAPNLGVMAQSVESSPAGHAIVQDDPQSGYKKLDHAALLSAVAAGAGRLHQRVSALEALVRGGGRQ